MTLQTLIELELIYVGISIWLYIFLWISVDTVVFFTTSNSKRKPTPKKEYVIASVILFILWNIATIIGQII